MEKMSEDRGWGAPPPRLAARDEAQAIATEQRRWYHVVRGRLGRGARRPAARATRVASEGASEERLRDQTDSPRGHQDTAAHESTRGDHASSDNPSADPVVLCLLIRGSDGARVVKALRARGVDGPIVIESAAGLRLDGTRSARTEYSGLSEPYFGDIVVDPAARTVMRRGQAVALTAMEFNLLVALLRRRGAVASRRSLLEEVWGRNLAYTSRTVDAHIYKLRQKLEADPAMPRHILTVQKAGYRLQV